jgi:glycosyltransferase involved in cell wall biosynthesis
MYRHSGIGRYLRTLLPLVLPRLTAERIRLLASRGLLDGAAWLNGASFDPRIELAETSAPIYSVAEQMLALRGAYRDSDLLWVPHYNAPLRYGGRLVVTFHDIAPLAMPEILENRLKRAYARLLIESAARRASAILCVSAFTQRELIERLHVPAEKTTVTHLGLAADWNTAPPHTEADGVPYLLYVGNIKPNKNLGLLLRAFAAVCDRLPHRLVLAGRMRGFGTEDAAALAQAESMAGRVRLAGEVSDAELRSLYAGAAVLVMPSLYEGFGLPLLEAMQLGCPVLSSSAASLPEVAADAALYFDPRSQHSEAELAACLLRVLDPAAMCALAERGRERVRAFSLERCAELTAGVLNRQMELAASGAKSRPIGASA